MCSESCFTVVSYWYYYFSLSCPSQDSGFLQYDTMLLSMWPHKLLGKWLLKSCLQNYLFIFTNFLESKSFSKKVSREISKHAFLKLKSDYKRKKKKSVREFPLKGRKELRVLIWSVPEQACHLDTGLLSFWVVDWNCNHVSKWTDFRNKQKLIFYLRESWRSFSRPIEVITRKSEKPALSSVWYSVPIH